MEQKTTPPWSVAFDPIKDLDSILKENRQSTDDVPIISQFLNHYVFVYGTLKRTERRGPMLTSSKAKFCGVGMTIDTYDMLLSPTERFQESFPLLVRDTTQSRLHRVKGEIWLVPTGLLMKMDKIESNGYMYQRRKIPIVSGKNRCDAWVYEGVPDFWRLIPEAKDVPVTEQNSQTYYEYKGGY